MRSAFSHRIRTAPTPARGEARRSTGGTGRGLGHGSERREESRVVGGTAEERAAYERGAAEFRKLAGKK